MASVHSNRKVKCNNKFINHNSIKEFNIKTKEPDEFEYKRIVEMVNKKEDIPKETFNEK